MEPSLRRAIARVEVVEAARTISRGTGALVAPDLFLTALHVVADCAPAEPRFYRDAVRLTFPGHERTLPVAGALWDRAADWILLHCVDPLPGVRPIPIAHAPADRAPWETFGFPDAAARDGMAHTGTVKHYGEQDGAPVFQLFSEEAGAAGGAPVKGMSGGPVIVEGALVAIIRSALLSGDKTVSGTLYGTPINCVLDRAGDRLPIPDPCRGLPGLRRRPLPPIPFNYLNRYTSAEAEIFFGRNREIRQLYDRLTSDDGARIVLLYGQTGVGKSSFLDAGLVPRLEWTHSVRYTRRDPARSLIDTVRHALLPEGAGDQVDLAALWRRAEQTAGRPLIVILDQVEEIYTQPSDRDDEIEALLEALGPLVAPEERIGGRMVLSFRKEWFPEIQKALDQVSLDYGRMFLESLDRASIVEVVTGLIATPRTRERYGLEIAPGLAELVADDLREDGGSPISPTLQILLSKMWQHATAESQSRPAFSIDLYQRLKRQGLLLKDFLDQQLARLAELHAEIAASGLALDMLWYHTTPLSVSRQRTPAEVAARYRHRAADLATLTEALKGLYLLVDSSEDRDAATTTTRLPHDTLAPLVRQRFDESHRPGQRAHRMLENRSVDWKDGQEGTPLDPSDLMVVEAGLSGMGALDVDQRRLFEASLQRRTTERMKALRTRMTAAIMVVALLAVVATAIIIQQRSEVDRRAAVAATWTSRANDLVKTDPTLAALVLAELRGYPEPDDGIRAALSVITQSLSTAISNPGQGPVRSIALSPDGQQILSASEDGTARIGPFEGGPTTVVLDPNTCDTKPAKRLPLLGAAYNPSATQIVTHSLDATARLWSVDGKCLQSFPHDNTVRSVDFNREGNFLVTTVDRSNRALIWRTDPPSATPLHELKHDATVMSAAFGSPSANGERLLTVAGGALYIWTFSPGAAPTQFTVPVRPDIEITLAAFSRDGRRIAAATASGSIIVTSLERPSEPTTFAATPDQTPVASLDFCPEDRCIVAVRVDEVDLIESDGQQQRFSQPGGLTSFAVSRDGNRFAIGSADTLVRTWFRSQRIWEASGVLRGHTSAVWGLEFSADGRRVVSASSDGSVRVWPTMFHEPASLSDLQTTVSFASFDSLGRHALIRSPDEPPMLLTIDGRDVKRLDSPALASGRNLPVQAISVDGIHVLGYSDDRVHIWRLGRDGVMHPIADMARQQDTVLWASFTPDGDVMTVGEDHLIWRRPINADVLGAAVRLLSLPKDEPSDFKAVSRDRTRALTSDGQGMLLWRVPDRPDEAAVLEGRLPNYGDVTVLATLNVDGTRVLTLDARSAARVYSSNGTRAPIELANVTLKAVTFDESGSHVIGITDRGRVLRWPIDWADVLESLDRVTSACLTSADRVKYLGESATLAQDQSSACDTRKRNRASRPAS